MAMTNIQKKIADAMQGLIRDEIAMKAKREVIIALFVSEGMAALLDADYQAYPDFLHISSAEAIAAKAALVAMSAAMGDFAAGTNAQKMLRFLNSVPL